MAKYGIDREDLLGGLVGALSKGRVNKVRVSATANTGMTAYSRETGKVEHMILPREDRLPKGCTMKAAKGLVDHETGHALFTEMTPVTAKLTGLVSEVANILEDPREEALYMTEYEGSRENIEALSDLGLQISRDNVAKMAPLPLAMAGLSLLAYRHDPRVEFSALPLAPEVMPFLDAAAPLVRQALVAASYTEVCDLSDRIVKLLPTPKPQPKPQPKQAPKGKGEDKHQDTQGSPAPGKGEPSEGEDDEEAEGQIAQGDEPMGEDGEVEDQDTAKGESKSKKAGKDKSAEGDEAEGQDAAEGGSKSEGESDPAEGEEAEGMTGMGDPADGEAKADSAEGEQAAGAGEGEGEGSEGESDAPSEPEETELSKAVKEHGHGPCNAKVSPADLVAELLAGAMEEARKEAEKAEVKALIEAAKSGLMVPFDSNPKAWKDHEVEVEMPKFQGPYKALADTMKPVSAAIRHALRTKVLAETKTRIRRGLEEGDLDGNALFQIPTGTSTRVFQAATKGRSTRTAVTFLVDNSGSMGGAKIDEAKKAAVALNEALYRLPGISTEILGFTYGYPDQCHHRIGKSFRDRDASGVMGFCAGGGNADGSAVRWAARRLLAQQADRRILIVLSDGWPTDGSSNPEVDLRAAVEAATKHGVETFGVGVMDNSVSRFYPKFVVIHDARDLTGTVLKALADMIGNPKAKAPKVA